MPIRSICGFYSDHKTSGGREFVHQQILWTYISPWEVEYIRVWMPIHPRHIRLHLRSTMVIRWLSPNNATITANDAYFENTCGLVGSSKYEVHNYQKKHMRIDFSSKISGAQLFTNQKKTINICGWQKSPKCRGWFVFVLALASSPSSSSKKLPTCAVAMDKRSCCGSAEPGNSFHGNRLQAVQVW